MAQGAGQTQAASNANALSGLGGAAANNQAAAVGGGPAQAQVRAQSADRISQYKLCQMYKVEGFMHVQRVDTFALLVPNSLNALTMRTKTDTFFQHTRDQLNPLVLLPVCLQGNANAQSGAGGVQANNNVVAAGQGAAIGQGSANAQVGRATQPDALWVYAAPQ